MGYTQKASLSSRLSGAIRQTFLNNMDKDYELVYTDYRDTYNDSGQLIQHCMDKHDTESLDNNQWESDSRYEGCLWELEQLKKKILSEPAYTKLHPYIEEWLEDGSNRDFVLDTIEKRDTGNPVHDMLKRSRLRGRAVLYTNYDSLPHNFDMGNTYYYDGYFKDIIDVLFLNPRKVKETFHKRGIRTTGRWPNKHKRNGKEAVSYESLAEEILNQCCYGLLAFMGMLPLTELYGNHFKEYACIVIPKGNSCGIFNHWNGGGSLMEMKLVRDLRVPARFPKKTGCDRFELCVDEPACGNGYCINEVYGLMESAWGEEFKLIYNEPVVKTE